ncbi:MAG: exosome protein [Candidatus Methanoplasma sp.]|jgi:RNA binding exosome subunit|nr:exosome protein [Candidatus Methanoplasma sp.]
MQDTFHWVRVNVFCYATENEELIHDAMTELLGTDEFDCDVTDSEHGNRLIILRSEFSKQRETAPLFQRLGKDLISEIDADLEGRIDDDCVFRLRLDKQELVQGRYRTAHHGNVLSLSGKVVSHPARKEIAVRNMRKFLNSLDFTESPSLL